MSTKYVLACPGCRKKHDVQTSQAGTSLPCKCGRAIQVPSLRDIRDLPLAADRSPDKAKSREGGWGVQQAIMLAGLMLGSAAVAWAIIMFVTRPDDPTALAERMYKISEQQLDDQSKSMSLANSFLWWERFSQGLPANVKPPAELEILREANRAYHFRLSLALSLATACLLLAVAMRFWPSARGSANSEKSV